MAETTARLALPLLVAGQAQKELYHNEALARLDALVQGAVERMDLDQPPAAPRPGQGWIVGAQPGGAWAGQGGALACWTAGGWRFVAPVDGMCLWVAAARCWARFADGGWTLGDWPVRRVSVAGEQVVGARRPAIPDPAGGGVIDAEARAAIGAILAALRQHGLIAA